MSQKRRTRVLVLWNQVDEDIYEKFKEHGPQPLPWNPEEKASEVGTVQEEMDAFMDAIRQNGFDAFLVNLKDELGKVDAAVSVYEPDVIFNLVEYLYDDEQLEANVASYYELIDVVYTGNTPFVLRTCNSKVRTKVLLEDAGLPTSPYMVVQKEPVPDPEQVDLEYPLIVKPAREDASGGIEPASVVHNYDQLVARCRYLFKEFEQPALVEEYIEGREIHAAILGNFVPARPARGDKPAVEAKVPEVLPLFEMEFDDSHFNPEDEWRPQIISYSAKWDPHSKAFYTMDSVCPPEDLPPDVEAHIREIALRAYQVLGCRDYARIDMRVDDEGQPFILEVNPNPDLADGSAYVMCSNASGRTYRQLLREIIEMALARKHRSEEPAEHKPKSSDHLTRKWAQRKPLNCPHCGKDVPWPDDEDLGFAPPDAAVYSEESAPIEVPTDLDDDDADVATERIEAARVPPPADPTSETKPADDEPDSPEQGS